MVSPGSTRSIAPACTSCAAMMLSPCAVSTRAVCGVSLTSFSMPARARATVRYSSSAPSCMMKATSPAAKSSPMQTEAISARETSTSALMSKAVIRPITASRMMGTPHRMMATHAGSNGRGKGLKMLSSSATSFFVPPFSSSASSLRIRDCMTDLLLYTHGGICLLYIWGYEYVKGKIKKQPRGCFQKNYPILAKRSTALVKS